MQNKNPTRFYCKNEIEQSYDQKKVPNCSTN